MLLISAVPFGMVVVVVVFVPGLHYSVENDIATVLF